MVKKYSGGYQKARQRKRVANAMSGKERTAKWREKRRNARGLKWKGRGRRTLLTESEIEVLLNRVEKDIESGNFHSLMWVRVGFFFFCRFTPLFKKPES
jgi:hypothetical protein